MHIRNKRIRGKRKPGIDQKRFFDARHHCFAYVLGADKSRFRAFDDGEPNHSAGDPILGQIRSFDLTNVLVVVVRYFGGVKLGVGGLISAYKTAANDALSKTKIVVQDVTESVKIQYDYANTSEVMRMVKEFDVQIQSQSFNERCDMILEVKVEFNQLLRERIELWKALGMKIELDGSATN